jgi:uncharacterized protein
VNRLLLAPLLLAALAAGCGEGDAGRSANAASPAAAQPVVGPVLTLPKLTGRVVDQADILSAPAESALGARLAALEAKTSDQLVVVTVPGLGNETIEDFGRRLGNGWGLGDEALDNGILLIVAPRERMTRIAVGNGLEGLMTDGRARQIVEAMVLRFKARDFDGGVKTGVEEIARTLEGETRRPMPLQVPETA